MPSTAHAQGRITSRFAGSTGALALTIFWRRLTVSKSIHAPATPATIADVSVIMQGRQMVRS